MISVDLLIFIFNVSIDFCFNFLFLFSNYCVPGNKLIVKIDHTHTHTHTQTQHNQYFCNTTLSSVTGNFTKIETFITIGNL